MSMRSDMGPFAIVPLWLLRRGLSSPALHVYAVLAAVYADREGRAWPSRATLAEEVGCSTDLVDRCIKELMKAGALVKERRWRDGGGATSNVYVLRYSRPGEAADHEPQNPDTCPDHEPQNPGLYKPQNPDTNHTHIEPDPDPLRGSVARDGEKAERRHTPGDVFRLYDERWRRLYPGQKHAFTGQHAKQAKELLLVLSPEELAARMDGYFASGRPYYAEQRHSFDTFARDVNRFLPASAAAGAGAPDEDDTDEATRRSLSEIRRRRLQRQKGGQHGAPTTH